MSGSKSVYYKERYDRIASNIRKLCRLYHSTYVDSFTSSLIDSNSYETCQDRHIIRSFENLSEKFLLSGRWTDHEMLQQMWRDFKVLHRQACEDKRCHLQQSIVDTGYTATHGMLQLLMLLANSPTRSGKAVYVSDDFVCLENLSMLIPIRKEYTDTSDVSEQNDYSYDYWSMEYDDGHQSQDEEWSDLEDQVEVEESSRQFVEDEDSRTDHEDYLREVSSRSFVSEEDLNTYTLFGRNLTTYQLTSPTQTYFAIEGSTNPVAESLISLAAGGSSSAFLCPEGDVVKMVLEMLTGSESELFLASEGGFLLTATAARLRLSSQSVTPTALERMLLWFTKLGSIAASCRTFAFEAPSRSHRSSAGPAYHLTHFLMVFSGLTEPIQAVAQEYLGRFQQKICEWELTLFCDNQHETLTLLRLYSHLKPWQSCLQVLRDIIFSVESITIKSQGESASFDPAKKKFLENRLLQELMHGVSYFTMNEVRHEIEILVQQNHFSALRKASLLNNLVLDLNVKTNVSLHDMLVEAFLSCTSLHLDGFLYSVWTGVLHKRVSEDAARQESVLAAAAQSRVEDAKPDEEKERISRFRETLSGFQRAASSKASNSTNEIGKASLAPTEIG